MKYLIVCFIVLATGEVFSQTTLDLETCYKLTQENYPLVKQRALIEKTREFSIDNIAKGSWPQLIISGQASHQSDVTKIPVSFPGVDIPQVPKDQYRLYGEASQPLTDLMTVSKQKEIQEVSSKIQEQNIEVELYKLKDRVNQLFFGILLLEEQTVQNELLKKDIQVAINRTSAAFDNGTEFKSNVDKLKAEILKANQRSIELRSTASAYRQMLGLMINRDLGENTTLQKPGTFLQIDGINRPELKLYEYQKQGYDLQNKLIGTRNMPKFSLFFQGGFGQPSPVNLLSNKISPYYIGGLRLNWNLSNFYTTDKERQLLALNQDIVQTQKEVFLFNTNVALRQQSAEIARLRELIGTDDEIITLRTSIKQASDAQLVNGVITVNDFLREVNAEDQARQNKVLHEIQLLLAQYSYQATAGN